MNARLRFLHRKRGFFRANLTYQKSSSVSGTGPLEVRFPQGGTKTHSKCGTGEHCSPRSYAKTYFYVSNSDSFRSNCGFAIQKNPHPRAWHNVFLNKLILPGNSQVSGFTCSKQTLTYGNFVASHSNRSSLIFVVFATTS